MDLHNLMEELVIDSVEEVFSNPSYIEQFGCSDDLACKTDVICFVLNRVPPIYTTSSRGLAHIGKSYIDNPQITADIAAMVSEGIRQVGTHRRNEGIAGKAEIPEPPIFNFPIIKGKVIDGKTFAPHSGSEISLKLNGELVQMHGSRWSNPCQLVDETEGGFLFWPHPLKSDTLGEEHSFSLSIELNAEGFKPVKHYIKIKLTSESEFENSMEVNKIFRVEPIYLFDINEPEEITP